MEQSEEKTNWIKTEQHKATRKAKWSKAKKRASKHNKTKQIKQNAAERSEGNTPEQSKAKRTKVELNNAKQIKQNTPTQQ